MPQPFKGRPSITVGMSVWNCQDTIQQAVDSIVAQTHNNWELLILDDGSTDSTLEILKSYDDSRVKVLTDGKRLGLACRLNQLLSTGRGEYFARMDGDDISYPKRLEAQLNFLVANPDVDLLGTGVIVIDRTGLAFGKRIGPPTHEEICARPWARLPVTHPTFMGKMNWFRRFGYRSKFAKAQDQDLLLRSYRRSRFANLPDILLAYREDKLDLMKILSSRRYFSAAAFERFRKEGEIVSALRSLFEQALKGAVDVFATWTGLEYKILSHRAMPITSNEIIQWEIVWKALTGQDVPYG